MPHRPDNPEEDAQWRNAGDRIQNLLDASAAGGAVAHERAEQLVREVTDLYGAALERMMAMAVDANPELADAFAADDLIASLLLVHGLHPHDRRAADRGRTGQRAPLPRLARRRRPSARGRRRGRPAAVRRELQELPVVVGHPRAGGRGRGAGGRARDLVHRSGDQQRWGIGADARGDSGGQPDEPHAYPATRARVASGARRRRSHSGRSRRIRGGGHHRAGLPGR